MAKKQKVFVYNQISSANLSILRTKRMNTSNRHINFKRLEIPKTDGSLRSLSIPAPSWRIYLHGLNHLMVNFFHKYQSPNQHGFWPGRGTDTAWIKIHEMIEKRPPYIYEFDLKRYFDSLNLNYLKEVLRVAEVPEWLVEKIDVMNRSLPNNHVPLQKIEWSRQSQNEDFVYYWLNKHISLSNTALLSIADQIRKSVVAQNPKYGNYEFYRGVPQGSPLSPLLASIVLHANLLRNVNLIQYADDGILYGDSESIRSALNFPKASGIEVNWEKSDWIKKVDWLRPIKFLGKKFVPSSLVTLEMTQGLPLPVPRAQDGLLMNATRTLKPFVFTDYGLILRADQYDKNRLPPEKKVSWEKRKECFSFEDWFKTKYFGFVTSRLYNGSMDLMDLQQDFEYTYVDNSWSYLENKRPYFLRRMNGESFSIPLDIFNSSSIACKSLLRQVRYLRKKKKINANPSP